MAFSRPSSEGGIQNESLFSLSCFGGIDALGFFNAVKRF